METPGRDLHFGGSNVEQYLEKPFRNRVKVAPTTLFNIDAILKGFYKYFRVSPQPKCRFRPGVSISGPDF